MTKEQEVIVKAAEILKGFPRGLEAKNLKIELQKCLPSVKPNTIEGYVWKLDRISNVQISKSRRGFFVLKDYQSETNETVGLNSKDAEFHEDKDLSSHLQEELFYPKFAEYLMDGISECNSAVPFGDSRGGPKWGNPDVIGWFDIGKAIFNQNPEIVSGELKKDSSWDKIVTGFGQACSYLLFSHKSYLAVPKQIKEEDRSRIESLCIIFGIGLIYFDKNNPEDPKFELRNRALRHEPNILYINERAKEISDALTKRNNKGV